MTLTVDSQNDYTKKYHIADAGTKVTITLTPKSSTSVIAQNSIVVRTTNGEIVNSSYSTNTTNTSVKATFTMPADNVIIESEETALNQWINNGDATLQPQGNIYEISTAEQLAQIAYLSKNNNETFAGKTIKIMNDIDMQYSTIFENVNMLWTPIENFRGTIEGNNHIISNLYIEEIEKSATHYGFIAKAEKSTIKQLHLHNVKYIIKSQNPNSMYMGGIIAYATSNNRIEECSVIGELTLYGNNKNSIDLGGIVGQIYSSSNTIINCFTSGKFESKRTVGGIVGYMNSKNSLTSSLSTAQVISKEHRAGGLVSALSSDGSCIIKNSLFAGQVASGNNDCGAITGRDNKNMSISNSYYDNQICTKKAVNNGTYDGKKQTTQLSGTQQASLFSSAIWHLEDGFYPRLKALKANTTMRSATAALYLNSTLDPNKIDNCDNVRFDIRLTAANDNTTPLAWATDNKQHIVWNNNDTAYIFPPEEEDKLINFYINDNEKIVRSIDLKLTKAIVINSDDYTELDDVTYNNVIIYDNAQIGNENDYTIKGRLFYRRMLIDCSLWHTISFPANIDMVTVYNESSQKHYVRNYRTTSQDESGKTGGHYFLKRFSNQNVTEDLFKQNWETIEGKILKDAGYIIQFADRHKDWYNGKLLTFHTAPNQTYNSNFEEITPTNNEKVFIALSNSTINSQYLEKPAYILNSEDNTFYTEENAYLPTFDFYIKTTESIMRRTPIMSAFNQNILPEEEEDGSGVTTNIDNDSEDGLSVWTNDGFAMVESNYNTELDIYTISGQLVETLIVTDSSVSKIELETGAYIIKTENGYTQKIIIY